MRVTAIVLSAVLVLLGSPAAYAETMKEAVTRLEILPVRYGTNSIKVGASDVVIFKGAFNNGNAWGGEEYLVLVKQGDIWQLARHEKGGWESTITIAQPHTYDDTIQAVHFMVPKGSAVSQGVADLYLLKTTRQLKESATDIVPVLFTLYKLAHENDGLNVLYFTPVKSEPAKTNYCSADLANVRELGLPWPGAPYPSGESEITCQR